MYYLIYQITNLKNGMIYVGKHMTEDKNDSYMGSGKYLKNAQNKYGMENFKKEILFECKDEKEMNEREFEIVNQEFIDRDDTYNLILGGCGGFGYINNNKLNLSPYRYNISKYNEDFYKKHGYYPQEQWFEILKNEYPEEYKKYREKISTSLKEKWKNTKFPWIGKKHSDETIEKMKKYKEEHHPQLGSKNSQYGSKCMYNENLKKTTHVKKEQIEEYLKQGWKFGAVYDWDLYFYNKENKPLKDAKKKERIEKKKLEEEKKNERLKELERKNIENKKLYTEMYEEYCKTGFNGVVKKYNYKYSSANFVQQCKRYVDNFIPQNGKKRCII